MRNRSKQDKTKISCITYYNKASKEYFDKFQDELEKKPYDKDFLTRLVQMIGKGDKILDIGCCSTAQQARFFKDNGLVVTSIDLSEECIITARQNFAGIEFLQMDMTEMDFKNESFHAVCACYSIIHIPNEKLDGLFESFNRILKPKGKLAITVHMGDFYGYYDENEIPVFYRTYTQKELTDLLDKYGFKIVEVGQRQPIYDFEFQSERIYLIAEKLEVRS